MKKECSIVRDILPLYVEDMVSEDTAAFVKEHLETCAECEAIFRELKTGSNLEKVDTKNREEDGKALLLIKKRLKKKKRIVAGITVGCLVAIAVLLHFFPIYRIIGAGGVSHIGQIADVKSYYNSGELAMLAYIGSESDRTEAQSVLRLADKAFDDCRQTAAEQKAEYGLLARYATPSERNASFTTHSLELWSAHLGETEGYLWVYYSQEAFDREGNTVCGSWEIPSLWKVEKDETGTWVVVRIKEHP